MNLNIDGTGIAPCLIPWFLRDVQQLNSSFKGLKYSRHVETLLMKQVDDLTKYYKQREVYVEDMRTATYALLLSLNAVKRE